MTPDGGTAADTKAKEIEMRKLTIEDLVAQGVTQAQATKVVAGLTRPAPREIAWVFKATEEVAAKAAKVLADANIKIALSKRFRSTGKAEK